MPRLQVDSAELDRFAAQLGAVGHQLADLDATNAAVARVVLEAARAGAPTRTGVLSGSVTAATAPNGVTWASSARYWTFVHWGAPSRHIRARPFILEALEADTTTIVAAYADHATTTLEKLT